MIRHSFDDDWYVEPVATDGEVGSTGPRTGPRTGPLSVPHDAMMYERRDPQMHHGHSTGYYPGGAYLYSKTFTAPETWRDQQVLLELEGVYHRSQVFLNGHLVGGRPSGYTHFRVPLERPLLREGRNVLEVVARNADQPNSRWYTGSGIYRPVHLLVGGPVHVGPGTLRTVTASVRDGNAVVHVSAGVVNTTDRDRPVTVTAEVVDEASGVVAREHEEVVARAGSVTDVHLSLAVEHAALWSPERPLLHTARVEVDESGELLDADAVDFGIRTVTVDARHGLRINGVTTKLRGAAIHHDNGVIGAHTLDTAEERRVRILKESGYNAIRSAHNPISRALLRACDRHGMLVMDELTDAWWRPMARFDYGLDFLEWWRRDLEAMVEKDINHPSVVLYSLGNEIPETGGARGAELARQMVSVVREVDPSRPTTMAVNGFVNLFAPQKDEPASPDSGETSDDGGAVAVANLLVGAIEKVMHLVARLPAVDRKTRDTFAALDVAGYNYMHRRYRQDAEKYPDRVILGTETQPSATAEVWPVVEALPQVIGDFVWTGWDYIGEVGIASPRYDDRRRLVVPFPAQLAGEPIIDITGHRQTQSYVNQVIWHQHRGPFIAVRPLNHAGRRRVHTGWRVSDSLRSWSWEGLEGRTAEVEVYADANRVDLLLDGRVVGSRDVRADDQHRATFSLPYRSGTLEAVAYTGAGVEVGRDVLVSAAGGLRLSVTPETEEVPADGAALVFVPVELTDERGVLRPLADRRVTVSVTGAGSLLGLGSADPMAVEGFSGSSTSTYYGRALAVVRAGRQPGLVSVRVEADGCEPVVLTLSVVAPAGDPTRPGGPPVPAAPAAPAGTTGGGSTVRR